VYQAERYLYDCLDSLIKQNLNNYEIICIDDGSTDASAQIIKRFMALYSCIRYFYQPNMGVSMARNHGITKALGQYIMFVDADDTLRANSLKYLYTNAKKSRADIFVFGGRPNPPFLIPEWIKEAFFTKNNIYINNFARALFYENGARPSVCNKVFRRSICKDCMFPEHISISEDLAFLFMLFPKAKIIVFCSKCIYRYRISNKNSAMHMIEEKPAYFFENHVSTIEYVIKIWDNYRILESQKSELKNWSISFLEYIYKKLDRNQRNQYSERLKFIFQMLDISYVDAIQELSQTQEYKPFSMKKSYDSVNRQLSQYGLIYGTVSILSKIYIKLRRLLKD